MPKRSKYPGLRSHSWKTSGGEVRTAYYFESTEGGKRTEKPLGTDYAEAIRQWDELKNRAPRIAGTLEEAFTAWERDELPNYTSAETRKDYGKCLRNLRPVFGPARWVEVTFPLLKQYLRKRSGKTRANRELAVLSVIWNWARGEGLTELTWPAHGMERARWKNPEQAREFDVTDALFAAVYAKADQVLRDCMDIATATAMRLTDCRTVVMPPDGILHVKASKTGKRAAFDVTLSEVLPGLIERRKAYRASHLMLLSTPTGRPVTQRMLRDRWDAARAAAVDDPANVKIADDLRRMWLRDMRKRAADLAESLQAAAELLQHPDQRTTAKHYRQKVAVLKPSR